MSLHITCGVDTGSSGVKVAIMTSRAGQDGVVIGRSVQRIRRRSVTDVVKAAFEEACAQAGTRAFDYLCTTGDTEAIDFGTGHFYGMTTHARGGLHFVPGARAVLDIGALHARAIRMDERGKVLGHRMTSQCASGSGQFLENIARYLGVPLEDVGPLSAAAEGAEEVSSICAVLAETDVINMVSRGKTPGEILRGIHLSIAGRLVRLLRAAGAEGTVALSGGLAKDVGMVAAIRSLLSAETPKKRGKAAPLAPLEVVAHPDAISSGAIGAALLGAYRHEQLRQRGRVLAAAPLA